MTLLITSLAFAATVTLPVVEVTEVADHKASTYPGRVTPIALVNVVPQVSGEILEVCFANGQTVKAGDVLYRLDSVKYEAAVKNAESKLAECKAKAHYAELSYERHKKLLETRAVSLDDVDNALSQRDSSRAALAAAQAELVAARDDLKHCTITAPIAGKIGSTVKTAGNYVTSGSLTLVTIVQLAPIRVKFSVSNREILDMSGTDGSFSSNDASVALTLANGTPYGDDGKIEYAENLADEQTDTMTVYALFANEDLKLVPGGTVAVTIAAERGVMRPAIPPTAVLQDTQGPYVWAVGDDGKVERRTVARGDQNGDWLFIEKGLKVGERVVADGAHKVRRGDTVKAAK
ncbi:MAG: efflux RND transporter periplasmic adaptor subunit [Kiritimatiellae bacterium]|nr:efflux RND transporter periplasmic adaptor subunit [Kiritimatiellia bacterium]